MMRIVRFFQKDGEPLERVTIMRTIEAGSGPENEEVSSSRVLVRRVPDFTEEINGVSSNASVELLGGNRVRLTRAIPGSSTQPHENNKRSAAGNQASQSGQADQAEHFWDLARSLNPDSVNFIRQHLTLTEEGSAGETFQTMMAEYAATGKDYYRPLDIEPLD